MINIYTGLPGSGKTLYIAKLALELLETNRNWYKKAVILFHKGEYLPKDDDGNITAPIPVRLISNIKFSPEIEKEYEGFLNYWIDPEELPDLKDVDIIWDEVATHMDATRWKELPLDIKRFLQQHRKRGIDIYGTTQEYLMIDIAMRRLVNNLYEMKKIFGSREPSKVRPPLKRVWGYCVKKEVEKESFEEEGKRKYKSLIYGGTKFIKITEKLVNIFDTKQNIEIGKYPSYKHIERY